MAILSIGRYALWRWEGLTLFLDDGRIEIDSNVVERSIRPIALNRKDALFGGSDGGGEFWPVIASLIETCKLCNVIASQKHRLRRSNCSVGAGNQCERGGQNTAYHDSRGLYVSNSARMRHEGPTFAWTAGCGSGPAAAKTSSGLAPRRGGIKRAQASANSVIIAAVRSG